jgi:hypothetical protein
MTRTLAAVLIAAALVSPFWFPYPFTLVLSVAAGVVFPPIALFIGLVADLMYFSAPSVLPWGLILGGVATLISFFVRRFIKARIIVG